MRNHENTPGYRFPIVFVVVFVIVIDMALSGPLISITITVPLSLH
jgi:hypothetical protein